VARHGRGDVLALDAAILDRVANRVDDRARIEERALDDRFRRKRGSTQPAQVEALVPALLCDLDDLDLARSDVEPDDRGLAESR